MKKILNLTLIIMLFLSLVGCTLQRPPVNTTLAVTEYTGAPEPEVASCRPPESTCSTQSTESTQPLETAETQDSPKMEPAVPTEAALTPTSPDTTIPTQTETSPTVSVETEPVETAPEETSPSEVTPSETVPFKTEPAETFPPETKPLETEPAEIFPPETEPSENEPSGEAIDTAALEGYGRLYAQTTYGYEGNPNCDPSTNAGCFPGARVTILTMEDGYAAARQAVDYQYACDVSMGRVILTEIDGVIQRRNINLYFEPTSSPNVYILWCYYGGEA